MERDRLARESLKLFIQLDGVMMKGCGGVVGDGTGDLASGMPGGARSEFCLFHKNRVCPAFLGEMPEERGTEYTTTDDYDSGLFRNQ